MRKAEEYAAAIRAHCLECSGGSRKLVEACNVTECRLWDYRNAGAEARMERRPKPATVPEWREAVETGEQMAMTL